MSGFFCALFSQKVLLEEPLPYVAPFVVSVPVFSLNAGFVSYFPLGKNIGYFVCLIGIVAPAVGLKIAVPGTH